MKKSVVLLILLLGLVAFALVYQNNREQSMNSARLVGAPMREYLLPDLPVKEVRKIRVSDESVKVNLVVKGDRWVVEERGDYTAAYDKIDRLVSALAEIKIMGKNEVGPSALKRLMLDIPKEGGDPSDTGLYIELFNEKGDEVASFVIGDATKTTGGASSGNWMGGVEQRYVRVLKDQNTAWLVKDTLTEWTPQPDQWLNKAFLDVSRIRSIEVKHTDASKSWKLERRNDEDTFVLVGAALGETLDSGIASRASYLLASALFNDVHSKDKSGELLKDAVPVTITTFDGYVYDLKVGRKYQGQEQGGEPSYYLSVAVKNDSPKTRSAAPDEKPEEKQAKDEQFANQLKAIEEKLQKEKGYEGWIFEVAASSVDFLFKDRAGVLAPKQESQSATPDAGTPSPQN